MAALGHQDGALTALTQALAKTAGRDHDLLKVVRYDRALVFSSAGQKAKAKADLERIYAIDPAFEDVADRLVNLLR
jgi:lipoprotein NlpI